TVASQTLQGSRSLPVTVESNGSFSFKIPTSSKECPSDGFVAASGTMSSRLEATIIFDCGREGTKVSVSVPLNPSFPNALHFTATSEGVTLTGNNQSPTQANAAAAQAATLGNLALITT